MKFEIFIMTLLCGFLFFMIISEVCDIRDAVQRFKTNESTFTQTGIYIAISTVVFLAATYVYLSLLKNFFN